MFTGMGRIRPPVRRGGTSPACRLAPESALRVSAAGGVTPAGVLPRIAGSVPREIFPRRLASANAGIARFLIDAKAIREADIPAQWRDELEVCRKALDAWLKRELGALHCIVPRFILRPVVPVVSGCSRQSSSATAYNQVKVAWFQQREEQWPIGGGVERLEAAVPRLGATALDVLDRQSGFVYPIFVPRTARDVASMLYWYGEEDETLAVEECCGDDPAAQAEMRADMVTKSGITESYPAWALSWKPPTLGTAELKKVADDGTDAYAREVASLVWALARMRIQDRFRPEIEGEFIGFGAVLSWREDDLTVRIYDDLINMAHEGEFCDMIGEVCFDLSDPETMQAWQRRMRQQFKAMRLIDRLIWRLSEGH